MRKKAKYGSVYGHDDEGCPGQSRTGSAQQRPCKQIQDNGREQIDYQKANVDAGDRLPKYGQNC